MQTKGAYKVVAKRFRLHVITLLALWLVLWGMSALAESPKSIRVGLYENRPKIYTDEEGQPAGLFVRLLNDIASVEGWQINYLPCQWDACLKMLEAGELDLMPDVAFSDTRRHRFAFHRYGVTHSWSVVLTRKEEPLYSLEELAGRRVGLLEGSIQTGVLQTIMAGHGANYTAVGYPSYNDAFAAAQAGKVDAVISNSYFAGAYARKYGLHETPIVFNPVALYYAAPKGDPAELLSAIDDHIYRWRSEEDSPYYQALSEAMMPVQQPVVSPLLRDALYISVGVIVLFILLNIILQRRVRLRTGQLRETATRLDHMLGASPVVLYQLSFDSGSIATRWISDNVERLYGFTAEHFVSENRWLKQLHHDDREMVLNNLAVLGERGHLIQEYRIHDAKGVERFIRDEMRLLPGGEGEEDEIVGSWNDLTESHQQAEQLQFLTHYDPLTRLPNRALLRERLSQSIQHARQHGRRLAVIYIDIDRFKTINETFGQRVGDLLLQEVADRLNKMRRPENTLARIGGDGFVLLVEDVIDRKRAEAISADVLSHFQQPLEVAEQELALTLSIGISLFPGDGESGDVLLQHAEMAMYEAKRLGRNHSSFYASSLSLGVEERLAMESALRTAVVREELVLHYQPQLDIATGKMVGVEALVRWHHPELGLITPGQFIPIAEEMGIIGEIGGWVLNEAVRQMVVWQQEGVLLQRVAVNLSMPQVEDEGLVSHVAQVLEQHGLAPACLELELTESIIMGAPAKAVSALEAFRAMGITLAVDDFGTGYSSLNYLRHMPINRLKIDQSFVSDIGAEHNSEVIIRAIIGLARSLELEAVAEGVEEAHQLDYLRAEGCPIGQGYLFSRPLPAEELPKYCQPLNGAGC